MTYFIEKQDMILSKDFLSRFCCEGVELRDEAANLWKAYRQWKSETQHTGHLKRNTFYQKLRTLGFQQRIGTGNKLYFYGIMALPCHKQKSPSYIEAFKQWSKCKNIYPIGAPRQGVLSRLFKDGFIADKACMWGGDDLLHYELVIVSRTFTDDSFIDTPPLGIECVRLPLQSFGDSVDGTIIATGINGVSGAAEQCLNLYSELPANLISSALHAGMHQDFLVAINASGELKFIKRRD